MTRYRCQREWLRHVERLLSLRYIPFSEGLTRFHSRSSPAISIVEYLRRIIRYIRVEVTSHP